MNRIDAILRDEDFTRLVTRTRDQLTRKVMSTAPETERKLAYDQFHALQALMGTLRAEATTKDE